MDMPNQQWALTFFTDDPPSTDARNWMVDRRNPECPFSRFVGNEEAIKLLSISAFQALGNPFHLCPDESFALLGPSSTGKTMLAKLFAETVRLPFIELQAGQISTMDSVLVKIAQVLENVSFPHPQHGKVTLELVPGYNPNDPTDETYFHLPPCFIFIDEIEALNKHLRKGLLKAIEADDSMLATEKGWVADTSNVCWAIATTDIGQLADEFINRFTAVELNLYSKREIAKIIKLVNPDWGQDVCKLVAHYCGTVPREAKAFAKKMRTLHKMNQNSEWAETALQCARVHKIDKYGMKLQRVRILKALGQGPIASNRMPVVAGCKEKQLEKHVVPPLMAITEDQPTPLMTTSSQGYTITPAGLKELDKRGIRHRSSQAIAKSVRELFAA